jgi:aspartokinase
MLKVAKFGGSSMADASSLKKCATSCAPTPRGR